MASTTVGLLALVLLVVLCAAGLELGIAMTISGFAGIAYLRGLEAAVGLVGKDFFDVFASYGFTVIPLFILMGQVALNSGIAGQLYGGARKFMGHLPGGLGIATVAGATLFKAVCGSTIATTATFGSVAVPEMDRSGYKRVLSTGVVASVGTLGNLIPPSATLMVIGMITQQSIGRLFLAGIVPGLLVSLLFALVIVGWCRMDPTLGPRGARYGWRERLSTVPEILGPLVIFIVVIGGLFAGFFTPTESGSVGALSVALLTAARRELAFGALLKSIRESLRIACMVLVLVAGSTVFGHFITLAKITALISTWAVALPVPPSVIVCTILVVYLVGGSFIDDMAFLILATPIFYPAVQRLGYDPIWFAIIISITASIGTIIPPVAMTVFVTRAITQEPIGVIYKGAAPFIISLFLCLVLAFAFPGLVTWLPSVLMK
ncbi:MAG: TRAP transporter large permease [Deltaproteobacteria bacterium]|nr:TRAP transporter large permease [Deltaproteobacteria bacterium]